MQHNKQQLWAILQQLQRSCPVRVLTQCSRSVPAAAISPTPPGVSQSACSGAICFEMQLRVWPMRNRRCRTRVSCKYSKVSKSTGCRERRSHTVSELDGGGTPSCARTLKSRRKRCTACARYGVVLLCGAHVSCCLLHVASGSHAWYRACCELHGACCKVHVVCCNVHVACRVLQGVCCKVRRALPTIGQQSAAQNKC